MGVLKIGQLCIFSEPGIDGGSITKDSCQKNVVLGATTQQVTGDGKGTGKVVVMPFKGGVYRPSTISPLCIDVGTLVEKQLHHRQMFAITGGVQRRLPRVVA